MFDLSKYSITKENLVERKKDIKEMETFHMNMGLYLCKYN